MSTRETLNRHLEALNRKSDDSGIHFSKPVETVPGRFSIICSVDSPEKSVCKIVCEVLEENKVAINFFPLKKINETGGYVPVPTNVKDIYSQYFQPIQVQTMMANDRMMVG